MKKIVIIGSGPGGYHAALLLSRTPCSVTLIDKQYAGGTCLNVGCIPTKVLLDHLSLFEYFQEASTKKKIFKANDVSVSIENLKSYQLEVIKQLRQSLEGLFSKRNIEFIQGEAILAGNNKVLVKSGSENKELEADEIIIATGSRPRTIPGFDFDNRLIVSSDDVWNVPSVPKKLLIIGSGPIGIEFARIFKTLGSDITIAEILDDICPILDHEISENLVRSLKRRQIKTIPNTATKLLEKRSSSIKVEFISAKDGHKEEGEFDQVLIAVGRKPNTNNLALEGAHVEIQKGEFIKVNEYLRTSVNNIWAIGDVTNYPQLAHTASFQARVVASNILGIKKIFKGDVIPSCIYGYPEVAFVGETEGALKEKNIAYKTGRALFLASGKGKASGHTEGIVKILMEGASKKILGAHIIGAEASNLIHELSVSMQNGLTVNQVSESIHAHPTYSETILEALEDCLGENIYAI